MSRHHTHQRRPLKQAKKVEDAVDNDDEDTFAEDKTTTKPATHTAFIPTSSSSSTLPSSLRAAEAYSLRALPFAAVVIVICMVLGGLSYGIYFGVNQSRSSSSSQLISQASPSQTTQPASCLSSSLRPSSRRSAYYLPRALSHTTRVFATARSRSTPLTMSPSAVLALLSLSCTRLLLLLLLLPPRVSLM